MTGRNALALTTYTLSAALLVTAALFALCAAAVVLSVRYVRFARRVLNV